MLFVTEEDIIIYIYIYISIFVFNMKYFLRVVFDSTRRHGYSIDVQPDQRGTDRRFFCSDQSNNNDEDGNSGGLKETWREAIDLKQL